jgi:hypothetical protein
LLFYPFQPPDFFVSYQSVPLSVGRAELSPKKPDASRAHGRISHRKTTQGQFVWYDYYYPRSLCFSCLLHSLPRGKPYFVHERKGAPQLAFRGFFLGTSVKWWDWGILRTAIQRKDDDWIWTNWTKRTILPCLPGLRSGRFENRKLGLSQRKCGHSHRKLWTIT